MNQFKLTFQLEKPFLSKDFEVVIISFLKAATLNYAKDFHEKLYDKSQSVMKSYTFSCYLPNARFQKEQISLGQGTNEESDIFRLLDRGIDDMEEKRELPVDEAFEMITKLRTARRNERA